jgi:hypothetical protein
LSVRPLVLPTDALAASARGAGQQRLAPSRFPSVLTAPQSARRNAPAGYSPSKAGELDQRLSIASIGANPHRQAGDTIRVQVDPRTATDIETRQ